MTALIAFRKATYDQDETWGVHVRAWYSAPLEEESTNECAKELVREDYDDPVVALERAAELIKLHAPALEFATSLEVEVFRPSHGIGEGDDFKLTDAAYQQALRLFSGVPDVARAAKSMARHAVPYEGDGVNCRYANWAMWVDGKTVCTIRPLEL